MKVGTTGIYLCDICNNEVVLPDEQALHLGIYKFMNYDVCYQCIPKVTNILAILGIGYSIATEIGNFGLIEVEDE